MQNKTLTAALSLCVVAALGVGYVQGYQAADARRYIDARTKANATLPPFSGAVFVGNTLYLAGEIGTDANNKVPDSAEAEAKAVLDKVQARLKSAGLTMDDLVSVQIFCSDVKHYAAFNEVYRGYFSKEYPARAFVGSGGLLFGARFEVQGIAVRRWAPCVASAFRRNKGGTAVRLSLDVTLFADISSSSYRRAIMLKWLMRRGIAAFERQWEYDASYLHEIIEVSPRAAWMFSRAAAIGKYRKDVPLAAWTAAAITAVRHEDCGPCTQLGVSMAEKAGVDSRVLQAVLTENVEAMPPDVALAWRFTRATIDRDPSADVYREDILRRWGPRAVISLAFAIVASRTYPTVKYALGHGKACTRIVVGGAPVVFDRTMVTANR